MTAHAVGRAPRLPLTRRTDSLPPEPTPLIGRERELCDLHGMLDDPLVRLVTLTGPGGIGKTRLVRRLAAERLGQFASGVVFVSLEPLSDPSLVPSTIAQALGLSETAGRSALETLHQVLSERSLLLVPDNFEQILLAATVVADLLTSSAGLLRWQVGQYAEAATLLEEGLNISRAAGDQRGVADAQAYLGLVSSSREDLTASRAELDEALVCYQGARDRRGMGLVSIILGSIDLMQGDLARRQGRYEEAERYYQESLSLNQQYGLKSTTASVLHNLGYVAHHRGDSVAAGLDHSP